MNEPTPFTDQLEARARALAKQTTSWVAAPRDTIQRELVLTLEHIDSFREHKQRLAQTFLEMECAIETKLLQRPDDRAQLESQLSALRQEQRRLEMTAREHARTLELRLLSLLEQHLHLSFDDD